MSKSNTNNHSSWQRDERVIAYLSPWRARYASIAKTRAGQLLILCTQQSQDQEQAGAGDLQLLRRWEDGRWWHPPVSIYNGDGFVPHANGTLTTLRSGQLIAPFVEATNNPLQDRVRLITSGDDGASWDVSEPVSIAPLIWATPYARPVELGHKIIMPVYGALSAADLEQTRLVCGSLQSTDGGQTWGDFSVVAGPDPNAEVSYEFPAMAALDDGPNAMLLAVVTARRLKARPQLPLDVQQTLMRAYSSDAGKTWSEPENLCVGSWPNLARMEDGTIACSFAVWAGWGTMDVILSDDGLQTVRQLIPGSGFVNHGWLPGLDPSQWGGGWARDPIPLPPVVPNLKGDWSAGHYGFSSILPLDRDHFMVAIGQRQRDQSDQETPIELERIETISIERIPAPPPAGPSGRHGEPRGQWYLAERWSVEQWQQNTNQPAGQRPSSSHQILTLNDGRSVKVDAEDLIPDWYELTEGRELGYERGYPVKIWGYGPLARTIGDRSVNRLQFSYSDDRAKTWQDAQLTDPGPLQTATFVAGSFFAESDGTLVAVIYGYQTPQDMAEHLYSCCLVRSHDRGLSWGDWSMVAYDPMRRFNYCEASLVVVPDGTWVAFMRTEAILSVPFSLIVTRSVSGDRGRTWSQPEPCGAPGVYGGLWLPDGGIATAAQNTCSWGLTISYDYGRTWPYALPATYAPTRMGVLDEETFWIYDQHGEIVSVYKR